MVREAAVDLVGKFILHKQELIDKYYDMLLPRILVSKFSPLPHYTFRTYRTVVSSVVDPNNVNLVPGF